MLFYLTMKITVWNRVLRNTVWNNWKCLTVTVSCDMSTLRLWWKHNQVSNFVVALVFLNSFQVYVGTFPLFMFKLFALYNLYLHYFINTTFSLGNLSNYSALNALVFSYRTFSWFFVASVVILYFFFYFSSTKHHFVFIYGFFVSIRGYTIAMCYSSVSIYSLKWFVPFSTRLRFSSPDTCNHRYFCLFHIFTRLFRIFARYKARYINILYECYL